jgi:hypothetical protein
MTEETYASVEAYLASNLEDNSWLANRKFDDPNVLLYSIAISLKRIADSTEEIALELVTGITTFSAEQDEDK